jgi:hypothetical protein
MFFLLSFVPKKALFAFLVLLLEGQNTKNPVPVLHTRTGLKLTKNQSCGATLFTGKARSLMGSRHSLTRLTVRCR